MKNNMGNFDRLFRVLLAGLFAFLYFNGNVTGIWGIVLLVLGGIFLLTSIIGFCPLYSLFHLRTKVKH